jgi:hypothetical protein
MIIRLLMTAMIVLAIVKFYLHDSKQTQQTKPAAQVEDIRNQLDEIQSKQEERKQEQLETLGL